MGYIPLLETLSLTSLRPLSALSLRAPAAPSRCLLRLRLGLLRHFVPRNDHKCFEEGYSLIIAPSLLSAIRLSILYRPSTYALSALPAFFCKFLTKSWEIIDLDFEIETLHFFLDICSKNYDINSEGVSLGPFTAHTGEGSIYLPLFFCFNSLNTKT